MSKCPKCGRPLVIVDLDDEISYVRVSLSCDGIHPKECDFNEVREIAIDNIRKYGTLKEEE